MKKSINILGQKYTNKYGDIVEVIDYINANKVLVNFKGIYKEYYELRNLRKGMFYIPYSKTYCNIGFLGVGEYNKSDNNSSYVSWHSMITRCYSDNYHINKPTYIGCTVCEDWHNFQNYAKWYSENDFRNDDWQIDKDIRKLGNKVYNPNTCAFVPQEINTFFNINNKTRGILPLGVSMNQGRYYSQCGIGIGMQKNLGRFDTKEEAFLAYKKCKEAYAKELAEKYKGKVHDEVYQTLINFTVNINQ